MSNDLAYYRERFTELGAAVALAIKELGEELRKAQKDLSAADYQLLENELLVRWTRADLQAAVAVADGTISPDLFGAATRSSKILSLSPGDQQRLLSGEEFEVYNNFGDVKTKSWGDMSPDERNRLLGPKGGWLHKLSEQRAPNRNIITTTNMTDASIHDGMLILKNGTRKTAQIDLSVISGTLDDKEKEQLIAALSG